MPISVVDIEALISAQPGVGCAHDQDGRAIALPATIQQVAAVVDAVNDHGLTIEIAGAGTKRGWGNPVPADLTLSTTRLKGLVEHRWQDLTATVGAGTPWAMMQRELAKHGQFVALDPLWPEQATVGGIVATNDSGALRLKYGSLRDLIIGMTIVLADGTVAKSGGKVVKNVAGYDLHKLMTGAMGTLGVVAEVTFRLHPLPALTKVWTVVSQDTDDLNYIMMKILDSHLSVRSMQMRISKHGCALDVELASLAEVVTEQVEKLNVLARGSGGPCRVEEDAKSDRFGFREQLFNYDVVVKATMLPGSIAKLAREVILLKGTAVAQAAGIMFAGFSEAAAEYALPHFYDDVVQSGGSMAVLKASTQQRSVWEVPVRRKDTIMQLMQQVKQQFDPKRTLNPGRFLGGI